MAVKLSDICYIQGWSKQRIEKWISDGQFRPIDKPDAGKVRDWSLQDLMRLMAFMRLMEMGCAVEGAGEIGRVLDFKHDRSYLVLQVFDRDLVKGNAAADLDDLDPAWAKFFSERGDAPRHMSHWCKGDEVARYVTGMGVIGAFVLDLDEIERDAERLLKRAERMGSR